MSYVKGVIESAKGQAKYGPSIKRYIDIMERLKRGGDAERSVSDRDKKWAEKFEQKMNKKYGPTDVVSPKYREAEKNRGFQGMKGGGKVYASHNKRYAHGGKVSGRKAKYNG